MENLKFTPILRFPEFEGEWRIMKLKEVFNIFNGYAFPSTESVEIGVLWVKIADVGIQEMKYNNLSYLPVNLKEKFSKFTLTKGDYVVALTRPILNGKLKIAKIDDFFDGSLLNQRVGKIESTNNKGFIYCYLQKDELISSIENNIAGTDPPNLSPNEINSIELFIPTLPEQTKIANFLTTVDEKISALKKKKELLEQYKKGVMQQIFSQKLRFKDENGEDYPAWEEKKLGEILTEHKTRNKNNKVDEVFSVAKHKGVVNQIEHLGRSYASEDTSNYKVVFPNDVIYTKSPTSDFPFGIIKQNKLGRTGIVSVLYGVFTPANPFIGLLLDYYFSSWENTYNYLNPLVQKGAKNTMNIGNEDFLNGAELALPSSEVEQTKIANFLSAIDDKISHCGKEIAGMEQWKKGLLQGMFV